MSRKNYTKVAMTAARQLLNKQNGKPISLWSLSVTVDEAVMAAGRSTEMFGSLFDYESLLPIGWHCTWLQNKRGGDKMYYVVPNGFTEAPSQDLLLGAGTLVETTGPD
jgi:hypothetical protein